MPDIVLPGDLPHGLALAEVTGDGKIDIITALSTGWVCFQATETLRLEHRSSGPHAPFKFKMADFKATVCPISG